ncbi:MAG: hypothetical protein AB8G96_12765 [Phycisphaerales bacterium]
MDRPSSSARRPFLAARPLAVATGMAAALLPAVLLAATPSGPSLAESAPSAPAADRPPVAGPSASVTRDPAMRPYEELGALVPRTRALRTIVSPIDLDPSIAPPPAASDAAAGACPFEVEAHTDADFSGGSYIVQAGFGQMEIAAASYTLNPSDFPIRIESTEMIFATSNSNQETTTEWSILVWEGTPANGTIVAEFSSDGVILPSLIIPPGTNGVNVQVLVDPNDPEQIIITDNGSSTFSIGYRIDQHNQQDSNPCFVGPPTCCNAFPTTDVGTLDAPSQNWLFGLNCGPIGCPANGGWASFSQLPIFCRPSGDWVMRATWQSLNCGSGSGGACCLPDGTCEIQTQADCLLAGGLYQGDNIQCSQVICPEPIGACCIDGECLESTEAECLSVEGAVWLGAGTDCEDPEICNPDGACCIPGTGGCLTLSQTDCELVGGIFQGAFTECGDIVCFPEGACCLPDGSCTDGISPEDCDALGGVFQGDGSTCGDVSCPEPVGACCLSGGTACLELSEADCAIVGGDWAGVGTTCADDDGDGLADDCNACFGDLNESGAVDFGDLLQVLSAWGPCGDPCPEDLDGSLDIGFGDVLAVLSSFGDC